MDGSGLKTIIRESTASEFEIVYDDSDYQVEKLHEFDDFDRQPVWKRRLYRLSPLFSFLALGSYYLYFAHRVLYTVEAQHKYDKVYIMAWLFICAEALVAGK